MPVGRSCGAGEKLGSLRGCLVEGDPEQRKRDRSVRRRALAVSVLVQGTALIALVLIPLFAKPEQLVREITIALPTYHRVSAARNPNEKPSQNTKRFRVVCFSSRPANLSSMGRKESTQIAEPSGSDLTELSAARVPVA